MTICSPVPQCTGFLQRIKMNQTQSDDQHLAEQSETTHTAHISPGKNLQITIWKSCHQNLCSRQYYFCHNPTQLWLIYLKKWMQFMGFQIKVTEISIKHNGHVHDISAACSAQPDAEFFWSANALDGDWQGQRARLL